MTMVLLYTPTRVRRFPGESVSRTSVESSPVSDTCSSRFYADKYTLARLYHVLPKTRRIRIDRRQFNTYSFIRQQIAIRSNQSCNKLLLKTTMVVIYGWEVQVVPGGSPPPSDRGFLIYNKLYIVIASDTFLLVNFLFK